MPIMEAPQSGVKVRMYRQGHGDCFLLAFRDENGDPFYMLIDCGYKPGSQVHHPIDRVVQDIEESTGNHLHVVLITHEHQDHVNGFWNKFGNNEKKYFENIAVDQVWLAWTEDPNDSDAQMLRERYKDTLLGLMAVSDRLLAAADENERAAGRRIEDLIEFEIEGSREEFLGLTIKGITNKRAIQFIKEKAQQDPLYLDPLGSIYQLDKVPGVRFFALGPPRDEKLLLSLDPVGSEGYSQNFALDREVQAFFAAAISEVDGEPDDAHQPFAPRYRISEDQSIEGPHAEFFQEWYGLGIDEHPYAWRRIENEWLMTAEVLALRLNNEVNNTSVVLAIELPLTKKVLLFVGDAQRGNWISWKDQKWATEGGETMSSRDLLGRTVLYKVGHHGSHNATMKGTVQSDHPSLAWMATGDYRSEFMAMIPANRPWAFEEADWRHPLPSIEAALKRKAKGRVFRTDRDHLSKSPLLSDNEWQIFQSRIAETDLYFEVTIPDEAS